MAIPGTARISRRRFLARSVQAAAVAVPLAVPAHILGGPARPGPNSRLNVAVIGVGARGKYLIASSPAEIRIAALCDCYAPRMAEARAAAGSFAESLKSFSQGDARSCATFQDYRRLLERTKLDAVMIATPDHHHILPAILACQAGLDVYLEKPLSLTIAEGRALVHAVRRHSRVLQVGSQQRSMEMNRFACEFIRSGGLGQVTRVRMPNYPGPTVYDRRLAEEPVLPGLDWDLFCGPTAPFPHHPRLWVKDEFRVDGVLWRGWDLFHTYSGHLVTNWGAHSIDMVQWALDAVDSGPVEVWPLVEGYTGEMRLCPVAMRYAGGAEVRFETPMADGQRWDFFGQRGSLSMQRNQFVTDPPDLISHPPDPKLAEIWKGVRGPGCVVRPHIEDWVRAIRTRGEPHAPVEAGHRAVTVCHLMNLARQLRCPLKWDPLRERFEGNDQADGLRDRPRRKGWELPA